MKDFAEWYFVELHNDLLSIFKKHPLYDGYSITELDKIVENREKYILFNDRACKAIVAEDSNQSDQEIIAKFNELQEFKSTNRQNKYFIFFLEKENEILGTANIRIRIMEKPLINTLEFSILYVIPEERNKKNGKTFFASILNQICGEYELCKICCQIPSKKLQAIKLVEEFGFKKKYK